MRSRVKLSLITDKTSRRKTFKKRKGGIMKKLNELVTLCGVKACAVIYSSQNDQEPEAWPSRGGALEVISKFMEVPAVERAKKMYDLKDYTWERIMKEEATLSRLQDENREFKLKKFMFDLLKDKRMLENHSHDAKALQELSSYIDYYVKELTNRIHMLEANGESVSLPPLDVADVDASHHVAGEVSPVAVSDVAEVVNQQAPTSFSDHIQYQNMNQQELAQYQVPTNFSDHVPYQNMMNYQEPFQYQVPDNVYGQNQNGFYGLNQDMSSDLNHNLSESWNQYPNLHEPLMNQWMAQPQQMSYGEELASLVASMDYNYHQLPTTSHMPSMDLSAPNTNNSLWPTRFGLE